MNLRRLAVALAVVAALTACGPDETPAESNNLVGADPSASPSESPSPSPSLATPAVDVVVPTADAVPAPVVTTTNPAPVKTTAKPPAPVKTTTKPAPPPAVYYKNCDDVRAHGAAPLYRGQPGYRAGLDRDGDGVACEN